MSSLRFKSSIQWLSCHATRYRNKYYINSWHPLVQGSHKPWVWMGLYDSGNRATLNFVCNFSACNALPSLPVCSCTKIITPGVMYSWSWLHQEYMKTMYSWLHVTWYISYWPLHWSMYETHPQCSYGGFFFFSCSSCTESRVHVHVVPRVPIYVLLVVPTEWLAGQGWAFFLRFVFLPHTVRFLIMKKNTKVRLIVLAQAIRLSPPGPKPRGVAELR